MHIHICWKVWKGFSLWCKGNLLESYQSRWQWNLLEAVCHWISQVPQAGRLPRGTDPDWLLTATPWEHWGKALALRRVPFSYSVPFEPSLILSQLEKCFWVLLENHQGRQKGIDLMLRANTFISDQSTTCIISFANPSIRLNSTSYFRWNSYSRIILYCKEDKGILWKLLQAVFVLVSSNWGYISPRI